MKILVDNVGVDPVYSVVQTRLFAREEQAQTCVGRTKPPSIELAGQSGQSVSLTIPACRALVLKQEVPQDQDVYRIGVAGELSLDEDSLTALFENIASAEPPLDFVALLGNTRIDSVSNVPATLKSAIRGSSVPVGVGLGDYEIERGYTDYLDRFGATNYVTSIGIARVLALDTGTRTLSSSQFDFIESIQREDCNDECPSGAVLTWSSPLGPSTADRRGFQSQFVAQSAISALDSRGFDLVAAGAFSDNDQETLGEIVSHEIGRRDARDSLATLEFIGVSEQVRACFNPREPRSTPQLYPDGSSFRCAETERCVSGICKSRCEDDAECGGLTCYEQSYCRQTCVDNSDCPGAAVCEDEWCHPGPRIEFSR